MDYDLFSCICYDSCFYHIFILPLNAVEKVVIYGCVPLLPHTYVFILGQNMSVRVPCLKFRVYYLPGLDISGKKYTVCSTEQL